MNHSPVTGITVDGQEIEIYNLRLAYYKDTHKQVANTGLGRFETANHTIRVYLDREVWTAISYIKIPLTFCPGGNQWAFPNEAMNSRR